jgi:anti-anti-sigma factor
VVPRIQITENDVGDVTILRLKGRMVLEEGDIPLKDHVEQLLTRGRLKLVLDMQEVTYLDSAGIGMIVAKYVAAHRRGGDIKLLHATGRSDHLMGITKLKTVFEIFDSEEEVVASFAGDTFSQVPLVDIRPWVAGDHDRMRVVEAVGRACGDCGFFYVSGHDVDENLQQRLESLSRRFFAQNLETKMEIRMERGGRAWRGYFPVGGELTSGTPDIKEGIYFGAELADDHPLVRQGVPLHGRNLFPSNIPSFRETVLDYMNAMTRLGHTLMGIIAVSLQLDENYFADHYTRDPLILFRIFNYPGHAPSTTEPRWGVGEHTDYGFLTILKQDETGGLQVKSKNRWIAAPPIPGSFLCNVGDMLDRISGGRYRSTAHRVQNTSLRNRLSFPFFFDPNFNADVRPIGLPDPEVIATDRQERWDRASVHEISGTYGDYVLGKVSKVFPHLRGVVL